jgi:hypothetical protein
MIRTSLLILILFIVIAAKAQDKIKFGVICEYGYKSSCNRMGLLAQLNFYDRVTLSAGLCSDRFSYLGFNSGLEVSLFKSKWHPVLGLARNRMGKTSFTTGEGDNPDLFSWYAVPKSTNIVGFIGIERILYDEDPSKTGNITMMFYISYRESLTHPSVALTRGVYRQNEIYRINKSLTSGWGVGARVSIRLPFSRKRW